MIRRGELWWASLADPLGSGPGLRRPVLVVSANSFNQSGIRTVIVAALTSNLRLADAPGNVRIRSSASGLTRTSVVNVSQLVTADKEALSERIGRVRPADLGKVDDGLRLVLALER